MLGGCCLDTKSIDDSLSCIIATCIYDFSSLLE